ncbi:MAG: branched-chain amino acid ABC transporter permease [Hyphomicrobiales bacterium]|nr:MAG: branched-chain amino acid ABC transporter permease [Hyphomicrobiales bacterium]
MSPVLRAFLIISALLLLAPLLFPSVYYYRIGVLVLINTLSVTGMVVLLGYVGLVSLGHAGFFAIGAYATAVLPAYGIPPILTILVGAIGAALVAAFIGKPILRLKGHYLAIATLGFGMLVWMVLSKEAWLTGGPDGMVVESIDVKAPFELLGIKIKTAIAWYWICAVAVVIGIVLATNLANSPAGRAMRAVHESDVAAASLGIDVARTKLTAFIISAVYASVAGSLLALFNRYVTPDTADFLHSIEIMTMTVLGGASSVYGALIGALILTSLPQMLTVFAEYENMMFGAIMILTMVLMRQGLAPAIAQLFSRGRK